MYHTLMNIVKQRLNCIEALATSSLDDLAKGEMATLHGRKTVEAIASAALVAVDQGIEYLSRDVRHKWNVDDIFKSLTSRSLPTLPSPRILHFATSVDLQNDPATVHIVGQPDRRLNHKN